MGMVKYYEEDMLKISFRFPKDLAEWIERQDNVSQKVRDIIDEKLGLKQERNIPDYKKPRRPTRGRPRKDEDPNYVPPVKKSRGRPSKSEK